MSLEGQTNGKAMKNRAEEKKNTEICLCLIFTFRMEKCVTQLENLFDEICEFYMAANSKYSCTLLMLKYMSECVVTLRFNLFSFF